MVLVDSHAHLNVEQFKDDVDDVINRAKCAGVQKIVVVGFDEETITKALSLAASYEMIYAATGWHPVDAVDCTAEHLRWIEEQCVSDKVVAIGETGLDYHWDKSPHNVQKELFRKQINLAKRVKKPLVIHNREATADVLTILKEEQAAEIGGVMHCFSGSLETAKKCLDMNFYISLGGPVTFKNAKEVQKVAQNIPLNRLLIETDCPYLAPEPCRGKRNEPANVKYIASKVALLRDISLPELEMAILKNTNRLFGI